MFNAEDIACCGHESKYVFDRAYAREVRAFVERVCRPDPEYPAGLVSSIYFDTPSLHYIGEKLNSDYLKTKVRCRWYRDLDGARNEDAVWAEAKIRIGSRRQKVRRLTSLRASSLEHLEPKPRDLQAVPLQLRASGVPIRQPLLPLMRIRYRRYRYIEPHTQRRVCLDTDIAADWANPLFARRPRAGTLDRAVVEVKGDGRNLPTALRLLPRLSVYRASFSKYETCFRSLIGRSG